MSRENPKLGRPAAGDSSGEMKKVTFRIDDETERALVALEERLVDHAVVRGRRSALLRKLVLAAFDENCRTQSDN